VCFVLFPLSDLYFVDFPSVLWYCWLGLLTCKNRLPYNLYCVGGDVKHCTIQSNTVHGVFVTEDRDHSRVVKLSSELSRSRSQSVKVQFDISFIVIVMCWFISSNWLYAATLPLALHFHVTSQVFVRQTIFTYRQTLRDCTKELNWYTVAAGLVLWNMCTNWDSCTGLTGGLSVMPTPDGDVWHTPIWIYLSLNSKYNTINWCCYCRRRWVICQWRCWRQFWWGRSCCCIRLTLRVMTTVVRTSLASPSTLSVELSLSWPQWVHTGTRLWLDGHSRLLLTGSNTSWSSWLNLSSLCSV